MHIKEYCQKNNMTSTQFAAKAGISCKHLSQVANLKERCSLRVANQIHEASDGVITMEELMLPEKYAARVTVNRVQEPWIPRKKNHIQNESVGEK